MKKPKRKLKGMSLIEIIISLAILAIMAGVLLTIGTVVDGTTKNSTNLKTKITAEAPYAAHRVANYDDGTGTTVAFPTQPITVQVELQCPAGNYYDANSGQVTTYPANPSAVVGGYRVNTEDAYKTQLTTNQLGQYADQPNNRLNLEYVVIEPATQPTT